MIRAVQAAKEKNVLTIGFRKRWREVKNVCDKSLIVPNQVTARVQEAQELSYHIICEIVDEKIAE